MTEAVAEIITFPTEIHFSASEFSDLTTAPFDTSAYSRLKFGDDAAAKVFGYMMADAFYRDHKSFFNKTAVVIPAPSSAIVPAAATLLARHMMTRLNTLLHRDHQMPVEWTPVHRITTYYDNYAHLPQAERERLLSQDTIFLNRDFIVGKGLIFIDDCNITGTHEKKIEDFLRAEGITNDRAYVCFAKYLGEDAAIEGRLNHVEIIDAYDLVRLSQQPHYVMTTRAVRMMIEHPKEERDKLFRAAHPDFLIEVHRGAVVRHYHIHPAYQEAVRQLGDHLREIEGDHV